MTIEVADADLAPVGGNIVHLIIDADGDFSVGALIIPMTLNAGIWTVDVNFTDEYYFSFAINATPLPVELLNFNATPVHENVKLDWTTVSEINNDYFTVQKSIDGAVWEDVNEVNGNGTTQSTHLYATMDREPFSGTSYYRLKQTDFDGAFTYSETRTVRFELESSLALYPNPANDYSILEGTLIDASEVRVFNTTGQEVTNHVSIQKQSDQRVRLAFNELSAGVYWISVNEEVIKLIIK